MTEGGWHRISKLIGVAAIATVGALSIGCGPAPGYEPEPNVPRVPVGYAGYEPAPLTSEELAARNEAAARADGRGDIAVGAEDAEYADTDPSALTEFKPALEGHGTWVDDGTYGTVWVPAESEVGSDFVPYVTAGHWTYDDTTSWTWVSTYDWGWAPFHYGRWVHLPGRGWAWIPGRTYAGAWVSWRYGGPTYGYVGWAPLGPDWYWYHGVAVGWTFGYNPYYVYCPYNRVYDRGVVTHVVQGPPARAHDGNTREYIPANPGVGGPNGRVAAQPGVGGRIAAQPGVGGRVAANPKIAGPRPNELGIPSERVAPPPGDDGGLAKARALSTPSSAVAAGASPPATRRRSFTDDGVTARNTPSFDSRRPSPGASRVDAVARAPQVQGVSPVPQTRPLPEYRAQPHSLTPPPGYSSSGPSASPIPPSYAAGPSHGSSSAPLAPPSSRSMAPAPSYRSPSSGPSVSTGPSMSSPPPSFRSSPSMSPPSYRSSPSISSSPSPSMRSPSVSSSPSFRSSPSVSSSPSMRSSPAIRSSPSVSAPRAASPSISRPSVSSSSARRR